MKFITNSVLISDTRVRQRISPRLYYFLFAGIFAIVYLRGLWIPLMHNDSAHHANIALHMYNTGDYVSLIDREAEYLDKPHFLFWSAALCYNIFGVNAFAYKLTSFLFTLLGVFATYQLGSILYNRKTGVFAAFILACSYGFILGCNDVRMDAILTSTIICSVWQLVMVCRTNRTKHALLGALALAVGFSTKGMIALIIPGIAVAIYSLQNRCWNTLTSPAWLIAGIATALLMVPVLVCYYIQFDMHPEKVINGTQGHSGWAFILFGQSVDRLTGGNGKMPNGGGDPFYYFHTFLWVFLPWTTLAVTAWAKMLTRVFRKGIFRQRREVMTLLTASATFILLCLVSSKLPHYLNVIFPFVAIFTAAFIIKAKKRTVKALLFIQQGVSVLVILLLLGLCGNYFPITDKPILRGMILLFCITVFLMFEEKLRKVNKLMLMSISLSSLIFFVLNFHYYPTVLQYQAGESLAESVFSHHIPVQRVAYLKESENCNDFDFYVRTNIPAVTAAQLAAGKEERFIITGDEGIKKLNGLNIAILTETWNYNAARFSAKFIDPATRSSVLQKLYLIRITPNRR